MKAILIDAINLTVTELDLNPNENMLTQCYNSLNVDLVEVAHYINDHDSILVDEEGLFKPCDNFFIYDGAHQPFAGNGLIVGVDDEGETVDCNITLDEVKQMVTFASRNVVIDMISQIN